MQAKASNENFQRHACEVHTDDYLTTQQTKKTQILQKNRESLRQLSHHSKELTSSWRKLKTLTRNSVLRDAMIEKEAYIPLTQIDRSKLANHISELISTILALCPNIIDLVNESSSIGGDKKMSKNKIKKIIAQLESYRSALLLNV